MLDESAALDAVHVHRRDAHTPPGRLDPEEAGAGVRSARGPTRRDEITLPDLFIDGHPQIGESRQSRGDGGSISVAIDAFTGRSIATKIRVEQVVQPINPSLGQNLLEIERTS